MTPETRKKVEAALSLGMPIATMQGQQAWRDADTPGTPDNGPVKWAVAKFEAERAALIAAISPLIEEIERERDRLKHRKADCYECCDGDCTCPCHKEDHP